jgi:beta-lactamase class A
MKVFPVFAVLFVLTSCNFQAPPSEYFPTPLPDVAAEAPSPFPIPPASPTAETVDRALEKEFSKIVEELDGTVGIGVKNLQTGESAYLDRRGRYPMLSVHKLPIALAVLRMVDEGRIRLDQEVSITPADFVRPGYNSPLRYKYPDGVALPLREIIRASLAESDGTASDVLLDLARGPDGVEEYLRQIGVADSIVITESEKSMSTAWENQYLNWATPDATIRLLEALDQRRVGLSEATTGFLLDVMRHAGTGERRIMAGLPWGTQYAHKTGTGGMEKGIISATNDVGIISLPDGQSVAIAVYIRDAKGATSSRLDAMQKIAEAVWKKWAGDAGAESKKVKRA